MITEYKKGQRVLLIPESGSYQKNVEGVVTGVTKTLVSVTRPDKMGEVRYRISDGRPFTKYDQQQYPRYRVSPLQQ